MSPGFMPRPSLSGEGRGVIFHSGGRVAGVYAPAFVERAVSLRQWTATSASVAGVYAPAFVERGRNMICVRCLRSVAGVYAPAFGERLWRDGMTVSEIVCRRGLCPGLR